MKPSDYWDNCAVKPFLITPQQWNEEHITRAAEDVLRGVSEEWLATAHLLDLGCGEGRLTEVLSKKVWRYTGADISPAVLERAQEVVARCGLSNVSLIRLVDGDKGLLGDIGPFNIVISWTVLMHMPKEIFRAYLSSVHKVLTLGGVFNFQIPHSGEPQNSYDVLSDDDLWTSRWYPVSLVESYLQEAGFSVLERPSGNFSSWLTIKES